MSAVPNRPTVAPMPLRVLVANEPCAYREVVAGAFQLLRPHLDVVAVDPADMDEAISQLRPGLVVCSRLTEAVQAGPLAWVLLYPGARDRSTFSLEGRQTRADSVVFSQLLDLLDQAARLADLS